MSSIVRDSEIFTRSGTNLDFELNFVEMVHMCVYLCLLTEFLHSDNFILAKALAGLVVCKLSWVEKSTLDTLSKEEKYNLLPYLLEKGLRYLYL